ncbi:MAG: AmmeMemoRadiSam system protein B [Dehalococcoidia bacterium]|nr:MAG: AmmeMemoRadiSam system protein B [Dehalococcoidia bacterium]
MTGGDWQTPLGKIAIDSALAQQILAGSRYFEEDETAHQFEHAVEVQLPFLQYFKPDAKIVPVVIAQTSIEVCKGIGQEIASAVKELGREVVLIASSDMTHYESQKSAQVKDDQAINAILNLREDELLEKVAKLNISMCGALPAACVIAAARELGAGATELVDYRTSGDETGDYRSVVGYAGIILKKTHPLVSLAREAVTGYVKNHKVIKPSEITPEMKGKAGVFVSIHKRGALRGCIGTIEPTRHNIAEEIIANAISSATSDPRFPPVSAGELAGLDFKVDVLTAPEPVAGTGELDSQKYGVIVETGLRRGLLLPDLEGVDSVDHQIEICRRKAGIGPDEPVKLYRFRVDRYQ